jgi:hypothetical protein
MVERMPRQNRVHPSGHLIATPARGGLMGNRGCLHDAHKNVTGRRWTTKAWIACRLEFKNRRRQIMAPRRYTELFFLDEATALAAGHRPCGECRRADFLRFKAAWCAGNRKRGIAAENSVRDIDAVLHGERLSAKDHPIIDAALATLPDGTMWLFHESPDHDVWIVAGRRIARWTPAGYDLSRHRPRDLRVRVLTPPSIVAALAAGYAPVIHPSVFAA